MKQLVGWVRHENKLNLQPEFIFLCRNPTSRFLNKQKLPGG